MAAYPYSHYLSLQSVTLCCILMCFIGHEWFLTKASPVNGVLSVFFVVFFYLFSVKGLMTILEIWPHEKYIEMKVSLLIRL